MPAKSITFINSGDSDNAALIEALVTLGFQFEEAQLGVFTLLDTFDGRLHRAGMRLTLHDLERLVVVLGGQDVVEVRVDLSNHPRFARDLPPGPFRARVDAITDVRALLAQLRIAATRTEAVRRDREGRIVASAVLYENVRRIGGDDDGNRSAGRALPESLVEVHGVVGSRKPARRAVDALTQLGLEPVDGEAMHVLARSAGVDLNGFADSATVPLDPHVRAVEGVRDVLANLADAIDANWQGTIDHLDPEFLHDLRVAVRRTRAIVAQTRKVLPPVAVAEARDGFAWLGGLTGPARDLDVYLIGWGDYVRPLGPQAIAALEPVRELLERRQMAAHTALDDALSSPAAVELMTSWRARLAEITTLQPQGPHAEHELAGIVRKRLTRAQDRLVERGRLIDDTTPAEQVHDLRKDAKKLRYLLECFGTLLPDAPRKKFVRRLKALQDNLGEHQDAEVHVALIRDIAVELHQRSATADTLLALGQLTERLEQIRVAARSEFATQFAAYDTAATKRAFDATIAGL